MLNTSKIRNDFPILKRKINGRKLIYFDNAALTQIPKQVVAKMTDYEFNHRANIYRGIYTLADESTKLYEDARKNIADFIGANVPAEIVFAKNTTECINIVAIAWAEKNLNEKDIILVSEIEHNSNLIPWIILAKKKNFKIVKIPVDKNGLLDLKKMDVNWDKVKLVTFSHISGILGNVTDVYAAAKFIKKHAKDARVLVDGTQAIAHLEVNVKKLAIDFYCFGGAKVYGPTGIGVLWINKKVFEEIGEYTYGGGMIKVMDDNEPIYKDLPTRLESGTSNLSGAIGLSAAIDYIKNIGIKNIENHSKDLTTKALETLSSIENIEIYGKNQLSIVTFNVKGIPSHDVSAILDMHGIESRSGQQCVLSWHQNREVKSTIRISFGIYNTEQEIINLKKALLDAIKTFSL